MVVRAAPAPGEVAIAAVTTVVVMVALVSITAMAAIAWATMRGVVVALVGIGRGSGMGTGGGVGRHVRLLSTRLRMGGPRGGEDHVAFGVLVLVDSGGEDHLVIKFPLDMYQASGTVDGDVGSTFLVTKQAVFGVVLEVSGEGSSVALGRK